VSTYLHLVLRLRMRGTIPPLLLQYVFLALCLMKQKILLHGMVLSTLSWVRCITCALTEHHTMKTCWGSGGVASHIFTSALDGGKWSASRPGCFIPRERAPGTYSIEGWVGPRAGLDAVVKRTIRSPSRDSNLRPSFA
jgi:hypothetical protein